MQNTRSDNKMPSRMEHLLTAKAQIEIGLVRTADEVTLLRVPSQEAGWDDLFLSRYTLNEAPRPWDDTMRSALGLVLIFLPNSPLLSK